MQRYLAESSASVARPNIEKAFRSLVWESKLLSFNIPCDGAPAYSPQEPFTGGRRTDIKTWDPRSERKASLEQEANKQEATEQEITDLEASILRMATDDFETENEDPKTTRERNIAVIRNGLQERRSEQQYPAASSNTPVPDITVATVITPATFSIPQGLRDLYNKRLSSKKDEIEPLESTTPSPTLSASSTTTTSTTSEEAERRSELHLGRSENSSTNEPTIPTTGTSELLERLGELEGEPESLHEVILGEAEGRICPMCGPLRGEDAWTTVVVFG